MTALERLYEAIKESAIASYGSLARFKSSFQTWINNSVGRYGDRNTETLRSWALQFTLPRREFMELLNFYITDALGISTEATSTGYHYGAELCPRCGHLEWSMSLFTVRAAPDHEFESKVCSKCVRNYYRACDMCGSQCEFRDVIHQQLMTHVRNVGTICHRCRRGLEECAMCHNFYRPRDHYVFRYRAEGTRFIRYIDDPEGEVRICSNCRPPERSRCQPRHLEFQFPALNLERQVVPQDEIFEIATGGGDVSATGLNEIKVLINNRTRGNSIYGLTIQELTEAQYNFDNRWMTKEGNLPKRLAKLLLTTYNLKLSEQLMSEIGNIAQRYTSKPGAYRLSITRDVNQPRSEFVNGDSCWWTSYWWSRCTLKSLGGFGLRTWAENDQGREIPVGRAWMIPLGINSEREATRTGILLKPAPEELPADAYIVFNGYGPANSRLDSMEFGRMVASMTGKSYRKVALYVSHNHMYINGAGNQQTDSTGHGILVAAQEICDQTTAVSISHIPNRCGCEGRPA